MRGLSEGMEKYLTQPWLYLATAAFVALLGFYAWRQPRRPGARYFTLIVAVWLVWALAAVLATILKPVELQYALWAVQCFCILLGTAAELMFSLEYTGNEKWVNRTNLALLSLPAFIFAAMVIAIPYQEFVSIEYHSGHFVFVGSGLLKWGFFSWNVLAWVLNLLALIPCMLGAPAFSAPIVLILLAQAIMRIAFMVMDARAMPVSPVQALILFTNFYTLAFFLSLYQFKLLRVIPVGRDTAIHHVPYGIIVLDAENTIVYFNPAAQELPGLSGRLGVRQKAARAFGELWEQFAALIEAAPVSRDLSLPMEGGQRHLRVKSLPLLQASGWRSGQVFIVNDVTYEKLAQQQQVETAWSQASLQEREQLAEELHDSLSQSLAFLNLQLQTIQVQLESGQSETAQRSLSRLNEVACKIQEETRELIGNLLRVSLPAENFSSTLKHILADFEQRTGLAVELEIDEELANANCFEATSVSTQAAVQLVRILQEALMNVYKHAHAVSRVSVQLKSSEGKVILSIADDGEGFDPSVHQSGKYGLQIMRQRAAHMGGQVTVTSTPRKGTQVEVCLPQGVVQ